MKYSQTVAHEFLTNKGGIRKQFFDTHVKNKYDAHPELVDLHTTSADLAREFFGESYYVFEKGDDCTTYMLTDSAKEIISHIKLKQDRIFDYLAKLPNGDYMVIPIENSFYKFSKWNDERIVCAYFSKDMTGYWRYCMWNYTISAQEQVDPSLVDFMIETSEHTLLKVLVYILYSEIEVEIVEPGRSRGTKKAGKIKNDSNKDVIVVDGSWNKISVRTEGFKVRGHLAFRRCGPGRTNLKLVWIDEFQKHGYIRKAKKLIQDE